ncbi:hypothetical protein [Actinomadura parmotrematis]|uniref:Antitoxin VbhA domain-containing protein n=1 Tax=Actinomadura parmotrematis TaxID=2864039 RepID=A0ABS7G089_9ACTN|nr:hypothetical protein [Actinomadura parmotrematis]MBW8485921.1 hypothetical protein [Actinomadura parmotrematis]
MNPDEADAKVQLAVTRYRQAAEEAGAARADLLVAYADAVRAGRTPEELAADGPLGADEIRAGISAAR